MCVFPFLSTDIDYVFLITSLIAYIFIENLIFIEITMNTY